LGDLNIAVEAISNFFEDFHMHEFALRLLALHRRFLLVDGLLKLTRLHNHFLSYLLERPLVFVDNLEDV
jgi:exopolysaccharide biosynthesis predicted pyruvyltransferase EpsI